MTRRVEKTRGAFRSAKRKRTLEPFNGEPLNRHHRLRLASGAGSKSHSKFHIESCIS